MLNLLSNRLYFNPQSLSRQLVYNLSNIYRNFHDEFTKPPPPTKENPKPNLVPTAVASKFQIFKDEDSTIILDIAEERLKMQQQELIIEQKDDIYDGLNLESLYSFFLVLLLLFFNYFCQILFF